jgi:hypothetical protein
MTFVEQNIPVEEMKRGRTEELQRIGLILTHYATGRMTQALEQLELSVNYQFHYSQPLLSSFGTVGDYSPRCQCVLWC